MDILENLVMPVSAVTAVLGLIIGLIFIVSPSALQKLSDSLNKKIYVLEKIQQALDREVLDDRWFAKKSRIIGMIVIVMAVVIILQLIAG